MATELVSEIPVDDPALALELPNRATELVVVSAADEIALVVGAPTTEVEDVPGSAAAELELEDEPLPIPAPELEPCTDVVVGAIEGEDAALELTAGDDVPELDEDGGAPPAEVELEAAPALEVPAAVPATVLELPAADVETPAAVVETPTLVERPAADEPALELAAAAAELDVATPACVELEVDCRMGPTSPLELEETPAGVVTPCDGVVLAPDEARLEETAGMEEEEATVPVLACEHGYKKAKTDIP